MATHVLQCKDEEAVKVFHDSIESMDEWMVKADTVPEVRNTIRQALIAWKEGHRISTPPSKRQGFVEASICRNALVGRHFLRVASQHCGRKYRIGITNGSE